MDKTSWIFLAIIVVCLILLWFTTIRHLIKNKKKENGKNKKIF
jgi:hypothetical protein